MRLFVALLLLTLATPALAQQTPPKDPPSEGAAAPDPAAVAAARQIIEITQAGNTLEKMAIRLVEQLAPAFERANPGEGELIRTILEEQFVATFSQHQEQFVDSLIPVYTRNLSLDELRALRAFYDSPLGKKLIEVQPAVAEQAMRMGGMWGQKLGELAVVRAIEKMQEAGLETGI